MSLQVNAVLEIQEFIPTDTFDCAEDISGFDACVNEASALSSSCALPFHNWSAQLGVPRGICQTPAESFFSLMQFQLAPSTCRVPCTQLTSVLNYYVPQYLRANYQPDVLQDSTRHYAYYLNVPRTIKVSKNSPSYGFILYIAEISGWCNLFLGVSLLSLWETLGNKTIWVLAKIKIKLPQRFAFSWKIVFMLVSVCVQIYIIKYCITILVENPVRTRTSLIRSKNPGLCLSICLPQYTKAYDPKSLNNSVPFNDLANTTGFWVSGTNLSNKISDISMRMHDGTVVNVWSSSQVAKSTTEQYHFHMFNVVSGFQTLDFCHSIDLSDIEGHVSNIQVKAVNDITLAIHLNGQLLNTHTRYAVINTDTMNINSGTRILLLNSEVTINFEETSFASVRSSDCENYEQTWTFDDCLLDFALLKFANQKDVLNRLLRPKTFTINESIEQTVLQKLYTELLSLKIQTICKPDCRSLAVRMKTEPSASLGQPQQGINQPPVKVPIPLPPLLIDVNISLPVLYKMNEVILINLYWYTYSRTHE